MRNGTKSEMLRLQCVRVLHRSQMGTGPLVVCEKRGCGL